MILRGETCLGSWIDVWSRFKPNVLQCLILDDGDDVEDDDGDDNNNDGDDDAEDDDGDGDGDFSDLDLMFEASVWFQAKWSPISREWLTSLLILSNLRAFHAKKSHLHHNHLDNYANIYQIKYS